MGSHLAQSHERVKGVLGLPVNSEVIDIGGWPYSQARDLNVYHVLLQHLFHINVLTLARAWRDSRSPVVQNQGAHPGPKSLEVG